MTLGYVWLDRKLQKASETNAIVLLLVSSLKRLHNTLVASEPTDNSHPEFHLEQTERYLPLKRLTTNAGGTTMEYTDDVFKLI